MLEQLFQGAARYGQLGGLLMGLEEMAQQAVMRYAGWAQRYPGAARAIEPWADRARRTAATLQEMRRIAADEALARPPELH
jgi:hypothetical protein